MQQHPVPQNVTAYEFHLIGNMTIKQFLELGAGIGMAVFFYSSNLPDLVKWPLISIMVIMGAALAFLPFDGRPLDRMVVVFFKAAYSPTQFIWKKHPRLPDFFNFVPKKRHELTQVEMERQKVRKNISEYLDTLPKKQTMNPLDQSESQSLYNVYSLFQSVPAATNVVDSGKKVPVKKKPSMKSHKLTPPPKPVVATQKQAANPGYRTAMTAPISLAKPNVPVQQAAAPLPPKQVEVKNQSLPTPSKSLGSILNNNKSGQAATQNQKLPFPTPPETPNTLVGMVLTTDGKIVENAIVEVKDKNGLPVRALKSNKLGQFFSATQLASGHYQIEIEKEGLKFAIVNIELTGDLVAPLEIRARG